MGIYGKYTIIVKILSSIQMGVGILMISLGIAFRIFVCSWVTDASFGFWIGGLVFIGGVVGCCSATKANYSCIGYYLCFNSFTIMFSVLVIFCHSIACIDFDYQFHYTNNTNYTNFTNFTNISQAVNASYTTTTKLPPPTTTTKPTTPTKSGNKTNTTINATLSSYIAMSSSIATTTRAPTEDPGPSCYTHQTWSDKENGKRGFLLACCMISLSFIELLMSIMSSACCWATTKVQPTGIVRKKAIIQGTFSEMLSSHSFEMLPIRRRVRPTTADIDGNMYQDPSSPCSERTTGIEGSLYENTNPQSPDEPITNWYSTTAA